MCQPMCQTSSSYNVGCEPLDFLRPFQRTSQNYFHTNSKMLFSFFTGLIFALVLQKQKWAKLWYFTVNPDSDSLY